MKKTLLLFLSLVTTITYSQDCIDFTAGAQINLNELQFNALNGANAFNELNIRTKIGPNGELSLSEYTSLIYSMNIWAGGLDANGTLHMAAGTYDGENVESDWSPGPLDEFGQPLEEGCEFFDKAFVVTKEDLYTAYEVMYDGCELKDNIDCEAIPDAIKYWPGRGNQFLSDILSSNQFYSLNDNYWDSNTNGTYDPCHGDLPFAETWGCWADFSCITDIFENAPDRMAYWVMNDNKPHSLTGAAPLGFEVHCYALMFNAKNDDQLLYNDGQNNQTIQWVFEIVNKSTNDYKDFYLSAWFDYDLGCPEDDYAGVSADKKSLFVYNKDEVDGNNDSGACNPTNSFEDKIPTFSIKVNRGLSEYLEDTVLIRDVSSIIFPTIGESLNTSNEYYNLMKGLKKDGSPILDPNGNPTKFMFDGNPDDENQWSMCNDNNKNDFYSTALISHGPINMVVSSKSELQFSLSYSDKEILPCPNLSDLYFRNLIAQANYENCYPHIEGPSAPNLLSNGKVGSFDLIFDNDYPTSNNKNLSFQRENIFVPFQEYYEFEGYKIYQVSSIDFDITQLENTDLSNLIFQADIQNGSGDLFNYYLGPGFIDITDGEFRQMVDGEDNGVPENLNIDYDYLSQSSLEIGKSYYYVAIAYSKSTWDVPYIPGQGIGDRLPYLEGCHNVKVTEVIYSGLNNTEESLNEIEVSTMINGFSISNVIQDVELQLYTINGILVNNWQLNKNESFIQNQLETSLDTGIYILNIRSNTDQEQKSYKISIVK
jgi:hypothetical protein